MHMTHHGQEPGFSDSPSLPGLEVALTRYRAELETLATPGAVLTREAIEEGFPLLQEAVDRADELSVGWPSDGDMVRTRQGSNVDTLTGEGADVNFVTPLMDDRSAYNNFPELLRAKPQLPEKGESFNDFITRTGNNPYTSVPALMRAHLLMPEFMGALQQAVETRGGNVSWKEALIAGTMNPETNTDEVVLLTSSRLAYVLLTNLMTVNDKKIQYYNLGLDGSTAPLVTDPEKELWT